MDSSRIRRLENWLHAYRHAGSEACRLRFGKKIARLVPPILRDKFIEIFRAKGDGLLSNLIASTCYEPGPNTASGSGFMQLLAAGLKRNS